MYKLKRISVLCLALAVLTLTLALFSGCGTQQSMNTDNGSAVSSDNQTTQTAPVNPWDEDLKKGAADLIWYVVASPQADKDAVVAEVNKITQKEINTTLKLEIIDWGAYDQKMKMIIASGEAWDMCYTANWTNNYVDNANKGAYLDVSKLLPEYAPTVYKDIPETIWNASKKQGKLFGITNGYASNANALYIVKTIADKYKFDTSAVKSLYDVEPLLEQIKQNEKGMIPFEMYKQGFLGNIELTLGYESLVSQDIPCAVGLDDTVGKIINQYELPSFKSHIEKMRDWYNKGYIKKDAATLELPQADQKAGKYPVTIGAAYFPTVEMDKRSEFGNVDITAIQLSPSYFTTNGLTGGLTVFNVSGKYPERAVMLFELIHKTKDLYNLLSLGIEGKHYTKLGEDAATNRIQVDPIANSAYSPNIFWEFGDGQHCYFVYKGTPYDTPDKKAAFYAEGKDDVTFGFSFDSSPVKTQVAKCHAVSDEYLPSLLSGSVDVDTVLPTYIEKLKNAGSEEIIAEAQKQFDAWKGSK